MVDVHRVASMELWSDVGSSSRISMRFWQGCIPKCDGNLMGRGGRVWSVGGAPSDSHWHGASAIPPWRCRTGTVPVRFRRGGVALAPCQCDSVGGPAGLMRFSAVSVSIVIDFLVFDCSSQDLTPT